MEICHSDPCLGELLQVGSADFTAVRRCIAEPEIIGHDDEKVWALWLGHFVLRSQGSKKLGEAGGTKLLQLLDTFADELRDN